MTVTRTHLYPEGTPPGVITIRATDGTNTAQAQITILDPTTAVVTVDPTTIPAGGIVTVTGTDFTPDTAGTLTLEPAAGGEPLQTVDIASSATGEVAATELEIDATTPPGDYVVVITTGIRTGQAALTVTAPAVPLPTPTGLTAGTVTDTTVPLTWTAVDGADGYVVRWRATGATEWTERPLVTTPADTVDGLTAGTEYEFSVKATDSTGAAADSEWSEPITATTTGGTVPPLEPPTNVAAAPTDTTAVITWDVREGATGYIVQWRAAGATEWTVRPPVTDPTDTIDGLTASTDYEVQVKAVGDGTTTGDSPFGPEPALAFATTGGGTPLPQVVNLAASAPTDTTVTLAWDAVENATAYHIQYKATADTEWLDYGTEPTEPTQVVAELAAGTSYDFRVHAVGDGVNFSDGPDSDPVTASTTGTPLPPLDPPANIVAGTITDTTIPLTWDAVTGATGYVAQYRVQGDTEWTTQPAVTDPATTLAELTPGTTYEYQVQAVADPAVNTDSPFAPDPAATATTTGTAPVPQLDPPANVTTGAITDTTVAVSWDAVPDAVGYIVQGRQQGDTVWTELPQQTETTADLVALTPGTVYEYHVKAVGDGTTNTDSEFAPEPPAEVTTTGTAPAPLAQVTNLAGTAGDASVVLTWDAVTDAAGYSVQYKATADTDFVDFRPLATEPTQTVDGLTTGTSYDFRVQARGNGTSTGNGPFSDPVTVVAGGPAPVAESATRRKKSK